MSRLDRKQFVKRLGMIKLLALDVDGVLTDDSIFFGPDGQEFKKFNISDGFFMALAKRHGLQLAIVSGRYSAATESRMKDLGIEHVLQGRRNKCEMIRPLLEELDIRMDQVAFVGNELLDIELARKVGLSIAVADACRQLNEEADFVTDAAGGKGAVREVLEAYFEAVGIDPMDLII